MREEKSNQRMSEFLCKRRIWVSMFFAGMLSFVFCGYALAAPLHVGDTGLAATATNAGLNSAVTVPQYVGIVVRTILTIIGVVFLILVVYGGMQWMLAQGDEQKITNARNLIFQAIIGLAIVFAAYALTSFVVQSISNGAVQ